MTYDQHVKALLVQFYLNPKCMPAFHGRWDTYLASQNLWDEYFYMFMKTDTQVARIVSQAQAEAREISSSPLFKAMNEPNQD